MQYVSHATGVPLADLKGPRRTLHVVRARQIACWVMHKATDYSYPKIAKTVGRADHTTAMHAVKTIDMWRERDEGIRNISNDALDFMMEADRVCA